MKYLIAIVLLWTACFSAVAQWSVGSLTASNINATLIPFDYGTLAYTMLASVRSQEAPANASQNIWSVQNWSSTSTPTNATYNTNFFLFGIPGITAISPWSYPNDYTEAYPLAAISPNIVVTCLHAGNHANSNRWVAFVGLDNVVTTVMISQWTSSYDIAIGLLQSNLPADIFPLPLLPPNYLSYLPEHLVLNLPAIKFPSSSTQAGENAWWPSTNQFNCSSDTPYGVYLDTATFDPSWNNTDGASGSRQCILIGANLVFLTHENCGYHPCIGPDYGLLYGAITNAIAGLPGAIMPQSVNLSSFPMH